MCRSKKKVITGLFLVRYELCAILATLAQQWRDELEGMYLIGSQGDLASAASAAADVAVVADMSDAVRELGLEADVARRIQFNAGFFLLLVAGAYGILQHLHLILLPPVQKQ